MKNAFIVYISFYIFSSMCLGFRWRCLDDQAVHGPDLCGGSPTVLACVREWSHLVSNITVSFSSTNRTCCYVNRSTNETTLSKEKGSTFCYPSKETHTTSPTTATTNAATSVYMTTETSTSTTITPTAGIVDCVPGWTYISSSATRVFCYVDLPLPWPLAKAHCETMGGTLAHIEATGDLTGIGMLVPVGVEPFLGINDLHIEGQYVGASGQPVSNQISSAILHNSVDTDCSYIKATHTSQWRMSMWDCDSPDTFVCEKSQ